MKYILYFGGYDNDTYFYNSIDELLNAWEFNNLQEFINCYKDGYKYFGIYKIEKIIYEKEY